MSHFSTIWLNKNDNKKNQQEFFNSVSSYGKLRDGSLTYFSVFAVLYLEIVENIDKIHTSTFSYYQLIETSLMVSSI